VQSKVSFFSPGGILIQGGLTLLAPTRARLHRAARHYEAVLHLKRCGNSVGRQTKIKKDEGALLELRYSAEGVVDLKLGKRHSLWGDNAGTESKNEILNSNIGSNMMSRGQRVYRQQISSCPEEVERRQSALVASWKVFSSVARVQDCLL
jgi:hypothetical protein